MSNPVVIDAAPGQSYADITREFEASADAVFRAHADPDLFARWIGPRSLQTKIRHWDFRSGGGYAFVQTDAEGNDYEFRGVFHTVRENELIIQTFEFLGAPDQVSIDALRFEDLGGGRSRLADHSVFPSVEALESMISEGMEYGMREGYEKLDDLLAGE
ncbi:SRPBCC family protein [Microbacterium sp. 4R-513]|uniref:SRPBCC family protein n=1 Tax=Microbacterium sp. 4R-513 TaxID=2567934 RepID=UPI0013E1935B|nr:SRPBCC family protein [Microbacterium sp. 4R-513]QIG38476.1 SRPBCC family protein [Microbacterium sp. 4R-513]